MIGYIVFLFLVTAGTAQQAAPPDSLTLEYCYQLTSERYPVARNIELQEQITTLNTRIVHAGYYPDVQLNGRATYQSEVTEFVGMTGVTFPAVSKDQYEASLELHQSIYNGGAVGIRKELEQARGEREIQSTRVELHQLRSQIDEVYFGILLSKLQAEINDLLIDNLQEQLSTIRSRVKKGVLLPSQQHVLEAELIKARQDSTDIRSNIKAGYLVLGELIGEKIPLKTALAMPHVENDYRSLPPRRPEYPLFESAKEVLNQQRQLAGTKKLPKLSTFGRVSYGRPGLNFLNDDFHDYYIVGLQLRWNFRDFINANHERQALKIQQQKVTQNERAFSRQMEISLARITERITALRENIQRDRQIIELREQVVQESASQLENGVITATEYVTELNRANQARLSMILNRVRLSKAQVEYMTTIGQPLSD